MDLARRGSRGGFLFLTSRGDQHASLRGLISTWLEIAVNAMLTLAQDDGRRIWVILDELPTLHQVPSPAAGPRRKSRQFGGCFVLGVQVAAALRDLYGRNGAETISGLCGTRVVLAAPDRDTAQWSADSLGRSEVEEVTEGYTYGANTIRDGVSLTPAARTPRPGAAVRDHAAAPISRAISSSPAPSRSPRSGSNTSPARPPPNGSCRAPATGRSRLHARQTRPMPRMRPGEAVPDEEEIGIPEPGDLAEAGVADDRRPCRRCRPEPAVLAGRAGADSPAGRGP